MYVTARRRSRSYATLIKTLLIKRVFLFPIFTLQLLFYFKHEWMNQLHKKSTSKCGTPELMQIQYWALRGLRLFTNKLNCIGPFLFQSFLQISPLADKFSPKGPTYTVLVFFLFVLNYNLHNPFVTLIDTVLKFLLLYDKKSQFNMSRIIIVQPFIHKILLA